MWLIHSMWSSRPKIKTGLLERNTIWVSNRRNKTYFCWQLSRRNWGICHKQDLHFRPERERFYWRKHRVNRGHYKNGTIYFYRITVGPSWDFIFSRSLLADRHLIHAFARGFQTKRTQFVLTIMKLQFHCYHNFLFFDLTFNGKLSLRGLPISLFILEIFAKSVRDIMLSKLTGKLRSFAY